MKLSTSLSQYIQRKASGKLIGRRHIDHSLKLLHGTGQFSYIIEKAGAPQVVVDMYASKESTPATINPILKMDGQLEPCVLSAVGGLLFPVLLSVSYSGLVCPLVDDLLIVYQPLLVSFVAVP